MKGGEQEKREEEKAKRTLEINKQQVCIDLESYFVYFVLLHLMRSLLFCFLFLIFSFFFFFLIFDLFALLLSFNLFFSFFSSVMLSFFLTYLLSLI
jgi:hypothetical protein